MTGRAVPKSLDFRAILDEPTGFALTEIFEEYWPAYERWMRNAKDSSKQDYRFQLEEHMPELLPVFEQLIECFGGDHRVAQFLSLYNPPRVVRGCSQIALDSKDGPVLLRSYDHHPALIDALILKSTWTNRAVIAMADCLWGALDGINEHGLAISLSFGGLDKIGPGFAAPLIVRYVLETCATVKEAKAVLARIPVYMPYTFLAIDATGRFITAYARPDAPTRFIERRASTNHQSTDDWPEYCRFTQSIERLTALEAMPTRADGKPGALDAFMHPPLWRNDYAHASGTLYVAEYRTASRSMTLHWPDQSEQFFMDDFSERSFKIQL